MIPNEQKNAAAKFAARWKDQGYEKGQSQQFWIQMAAYLNLAFCVQMSIIHGCE